MREQDTDDDDEDEEEGLILKEEDGTERWQRGEGEEDKMESGEYRKFSQIISFNDAWCLVSLLRIALVFLGRRSRGKYFLFL